VSPRFIELCFQTGSLTGLAFQSRLGLPYAVRDLRFVTEPEDSPHATFYSIVEPKQDGTYDAKVIDNKGGVYLMVRGYRTMDLPDPIQAELIDPIKQALRP
jgi:hypothetical protein